MAIVTLHPAFKSFRGRLGNVVFANWKGIRYVRRYVPKNKSRSAKQLQKRFRFGEAIKAWKVLGSGEKKRYLRIARSSGRSGYHLFLSNYLGRKPGLLPGRLHIRSASPSHLLRSRSRKVCHPSTTSTPLFRRSWICDFGIRLPQRLANSSRGRPRRALISRI